MTKFKPNPDQLFASLKRCMAAKDQVGAQRAAEELIDRAFEALDNDDDERAQAIGRNLQQVDHPSGWELEALVLERSEQSDAARALLEQGVARLPNSWRLWELLGNLYSDAERFDEAFNAYEKALGCPDPEQASVRFNLALTHARAHNFDKALDAINQVDLQEVDDEELRLNALAFKASVLNTAGRHDEAAELARETIDEVDEDEYSEETIPHLAELHAQLSRAVLEKSRDKDKALSHARDAVGMDQGNDLALQIIRAITGKTSPAAKLWQLTVKGTWPEPFEGETEPREFSQTFVAVAETPAQGLEFIRAISPEELHASLSLAESESLQDAAEEPMGIVQASPYIFVADEEPEDKAQGGDGAGGN